MFNNLYQSLKDKKYEEAKTHFLNYFPLGNNKILKIY